MRLIAGTHKGIKLLCPNQVLRPTSEKLRGAVFNICQLNIENATFLDLFAGVGAMGLEALSRKASAVTFVDQSKTSISYIEKNIEKLQEDSRSTVLQMDAFVALNYLSKKGQSFDMIYVDPPYGKEGVFISNKVLLYLDGSSLLKEGGDLFVEDDIGANEEILPLKRLKLKSARNFGRTLLRHFTFGHFVLEQL